MKTDIIKVTPAIAKKWLETNTENNRNLDTRHVNAMAYDMTTGKWRQDTGEAIKFDRNGKLIDGQHRLHAIVKANFTTYMLVVTNLKEEVFAVIDTGKRRSGSDTFHIHGTKYATLLPAAIKMYLGLSSGALDPHRASKTEVHGSNQALLDIFKKDPEYWLSWAAKSVKWYAAFTHVLNSATILSLAVYFDKHSKKRDKVEAFFNELCAEQYEGSGSPAIKTLRKKLIEDRLRRTEKISTLFRTVYIIKTWNAYVTGKEIKRLNYDPEVDEIKLI